MHHTLTIPDSSPKGHHTLSYTQWGLTTNAHTLICVHGLTRNARDFDYIAQALSPYYRVICVDVVGRGKSEWRKDASLYNYQTYVSDMLSLMEQLELEQVDWIGTSMGGLIGMMIAAHTPKKIGKLVINDIGPHVPGKALERIRDYVTKTPVFDTLVDAAAALKIKLAPFGIREAEHWEHAITHSFIKQENGSYIYAYDPAVTHAFFAHKEEKLPDIDLWEMWSAITCPVLTLRGEKSDTLLPETAALMQTLGPKSAFVEFPGVGHAPALMEEGQIRVVKEWLLDSTPAAPASLPSPSS
jgi:pimeloyl-ACP methyl ester carboxylesterase